MTLPQHSKWEDLTLEEVRAMEAYKDYSDEEIESLLETIRVFAEIAYDVCALQKASTQPGEAGKIIPLHDNKNRKKAA